MEWETDRSLQARMVGTLALIAVLPLAFTFTMTTALNRIIVPLAEDLTEAELGTISIDPRIVIVLTLVGLVVAYVRGGDVALRSTDARVVSESEAPELHARVKRLAATAPRRCARRLTTRNSTRCSPTNSHTSTTATRR